MNYNLNPLYSFTVTSNQRTIKKRINRQQQYKNNDLYNLDLIYYKHLVLYPNFKSNDYKDYLNFKKNREIFKNGLHMYNNDIIPEFNYNDFDKVAEYPVIQSIFMLIFYVKTEKYIDFLNNTTVYNVNNIRIGLNDLKKYLNYEGLLKIISLIEDHFLILLEFKNIYIENKKINELLSIYKKDSDILKDPDSLKDYIENSKNIIKGMPNITATLNIPIKIKPEFKIYHMVYGIPPKLIYNDKYLYQINYLLQNNKSESDIINILESKK